ncbi:MAG: M23 family metallopeptidase [Candidatus Pacebacteria bacterium]|jgi:murein DD-endopeptidase MepM/ murein hydrolase activator NlpD|nr:M23 family metallopeptidase [Candidatus Paceibacterota bacterium]MBT4639920.1 M23 family metallopeptidase [Deltaproteobacteria bacterium]MBT3511991.1 M23 family metallopeptidase [Candidatus Paceibacterota bacterium]MBT4005313.1 M23 family metallopeptidase [Candidatus Paceibacterota bacterium]MBT4358377.1 M23 family metallopeptidase [Candidatus Paceibacterota bacterium]
MRSKSKWSSLGPLALVLILILSTNPAQAQDNWPVGWQNPIPSAPIMVGFGDDLSSIGAEKSHTGNDFGAGHNPDATVLAAGDGIVKVNLNGWVGFQEGNILIFHGWDATGNPITTHYGHVRKELVQVGQVVKKGQVIATAGGWQPPAGSPLPYQPHIHFSCIHTTGDNAGYWGFFNCYDLPQIVTLWDNLNPGDKVYDFDADGIIGVEVDFISKEGYEPGLEEPNWGEDIIPDGGYTQSEYSSEPDWGSVIQKEDYVPTPVVETEPSPENKSKRNLMWLMIVTLIVFASNPMMRKHRNSRRR